MTGCIAATIDGVAVRCKDLEASVRFYEELLGFSRVWDGKRMVGLSAPSKQGRSVDVLLDEVPESTPGATGVYGVVIGVTTNDVDALVERLRSAGRGVRREPGGEPGGGRTASVYDPDGHEVWISSPPHGSD